MKNYGTTKDPLVENHLGALMDFASTNINLEQFTSLFPDGVVVEVAHNMCVFGDGDKISKEVRALISRPNVRVSTKTRVEGLSLVIKFPCSGSRRGFGHEVTGLCPCSNG